MELPNTQVHTYGIHTHTHTHTKQKTKVERLGKNGQKCRKNQNKKRGGMRIERKKKQERTK